MRVTEWGRWLAGVGLLLMSIVAVVGCNKGPDTGFSGSVLGQMGVGTIPVETFGEPVEGLEPPAILDVPPGDPVGNDGFRGPMASLVLVGSPTLALTMELQTSSTLVASGGVPPYEFSAVGLPPGLTIGSLTGEITGQPSRSGTFSTFFTVRDSVAASASFAMLFHIESNLRLVVPERLGLQPGVRVSTLVAYPTGGVPPYTLSASDVPPGVQFHLAMPRAGLLVGAPAERGASTLRFAVTDAVGDRASGSCLLTVEDDGFWVEVGMDDIAAGQRYEQQIVRARGGNPWVSRFGAKTYQYRVTGLPPGISVIAATSDTGSGGTQDGTLVSGACSTPGEYLIDASAIDASGTVVFGRGLLIVTPPAGPR
jgi:hypothetical protein